VKAKTDAVSKAKKKAYDRAGYQSRKPQAAAAGRAYYVSHRAETLARTKAYRRDHPLQWMLCRSRERAKRDGLEFNITEDDLKPIPTHCPILGLELEYYGRLKTGDRNRSASLDQIIAGRGYVKGNVAIISYMRRAYAQ
jgi:hypothetical protein